jgi:Arc/MetJ-type ribon-helix-helix transcriptional regulator
MATHLPLDIQQLVNDHLASGMFASTDDVLRKALHVLAEQRSTYDDLSASVDDIEAGRLTPLDEAVAEIRRRHGWANL